MAQAQEQENFDRAMAIVFELEGGHVHRSKEADPGGETNFGISQRSFPDLNIKGLTAAQARDLYLQDFWLEPRINRLDWPQCLLVFDYGIHSGPLRAIRELQRLLGLRQDGIIGPVTTRAVSRMSNFRMRRYLVDRLNIMRSLRNWDENLNGWQYRVIKLAGYIPVDF